MLFNTKQHDDGSYLTDEETEAPQGRGARQWVARLGPGPGGRRGLPTGPSQYERSELSLSVISTSNNNVRVSYDIK